MTEEIQKKIIGYIDFIKRHEKEQKYFSLDTERKFIVDGNLIKMLPTEYAKLYKKDEFYLNVDPDKKKVIYYAYDIENHTTNKKNEEELGYFDWDKVVDQIYSFLTIHLKELTSATTPYSDISEKTTRAPVHSSPTHWNKNSQTYSPPNSTTYGQNYNYSNSYKERNDFCEKITDLLKENKTSNAVDQISTKIVKMCEEQKFDDIDSVLRWITFDKLNIPTMITFLTATRGADHILKERKDFYGKVKNHLMKIKPSKADFFLRDLAPGNEFKNIQKYSAKEAK